MANPAFARTVLITGCSRGIGQEFVRQFLKMENGPRHLFATSLEPESLEHFKGQNCPNLHLLKLDVNNEDNIKECKEQVDKLVGELGLNVIINNAGVCFGRGLQQQDAKQMMEHYKTHFIAPLKISESFFPLLDRASKFANQCANDTLGVHRAAIINIGERLGTFSMPLKDRPKENSFGYAYDSTKATMHMLSIYLANEAKYKNAGISTLTLYPGWVKTEIGGENAPLTVETSVFGMIKTMRNCLNKKTSGFFLDYEGNELNF